MIQCGSYLFESQQDEQRLGTILVRLVVHHNVLIAVLVVGNLTKGIYIPDSVGAWGSTGQESAH